MVSETGTSPSDSRRRHVWCKESKGILQITLTEILGCFFFHLSRLSLVIVIKLTVADIKKKKQESVLPASTSLSQSRLLEIKALPVFPSSPVCVSGPDGPRAWRSNSFLSPLQRGGGFIRGLIAPVAKVHAALRTERVCFVAGSRTVGSSLQKSSCFCVCLCKATAWGEQKESLLYRALGRKVLLVFICALFVSVTSGFMLKTFWPKLTHFLFLKLSQIIFSLTFSSTKLLSFTVNHVLSVSLKLLYFYSVWSPLVNCVDFKVLYI